MTDYLTWANEIRQIPFDTPGQPLPSHNEVEIVCLPGYDKLVKKTIGDHVVYIPRLNILGELTYSLLDYHLNPAERVTPNVCPVSRNQLWRQFIHGIPGEQWRANLYAEKKSLEGADLAIVDRILCNRSGQRIALLDYITLCQDRSARNWIINGLRFWAVDNGIFWPYRGRYADKRVVETGRVSHLGEPMAALVSPDRKFNFKIGIFSSLYAGSLINEGLLAWVFQIDWDQFFEDLGNLVEPLGYPGEIVDDWRFERIKTRAETLLRMRRFPTVTETALIDWQRLIQRPADGKEVWRRQWET